MEVWIDCDVSLPPEHKEGNGTVSDNVRVILNTGKESEDYLINGRWVWHCKLDNVGGYPVKWKAF